MPSGTSCQAPASARAQAEAPRAKPPASTRRSAVSSRRRRRRAWSSGGGSPGAVSTVSTARTLGASDATGGGVGGQAGEPSQALADELAGEGPVAVQGGAGAGRLDDLEGNLGAGGGVGLQLEGRLLGEVAERLVEGAIAHGAPFGAPGPAPAARRPACSD